MKSRRSLLSILVGSFAALIVPASRKPIDIKILYIDHQLSSMSVAYMTDKFFAEWQSNG